MNRFASLLRTFSPVLLTAFLFAGCQHGSAPGPAPAQNNPQQVTPNSAAAPNAPIAQNTQAPMPPPPPPPTTVTVTVPAEAAVPVRIDSSLSSKTSDVGETFTGTLYAPLHASGGQVAFPRGTRVSGTVIASKNQGRFKGEGILALELHKIGDHTVTTHEFVLTQKGKGKRSAGLIGGGAGGGALIGALAGGGKGSLIGGLIGGGAGTAGAALTGNKPVEIPAETKLRFELSAPIKVVVQK